MRIRISSIKERARFKGAEYLQDVMSRGVVIGAYLEMQEDDYKWLVQKYAKAGTQIRGVGDIVHKIAQPIAKVIDRIAGTNVAGCGGCAQRREKLNEVFPIKS